MQASEWTTVIKPKSSLLSVDFGEIWQYRDLYRMFVKAKWRSGLKPSPWQ